MKNKNSSDPFDPFASDQERLTKQMMKGRQNIHLLVVFGAVAIIVLGLFVIFNRLPWFML